MIINGHAVKNGQRTNVIHTIPLASPTRQNSHGPHVKKKNAARSKPRRRRTPQITQRLARLSTMSLLA